MPGSLITGLVSLISSIPADLGAAGGAIGSALGGSAIADAAGAGLVDAAVGAGVGTAGAAIEGKPLGQGALLGGITGGALGALGPAVQGATGLGAAGADALVGAGAGALGGLATGQNPLTGALEGGAGGFLSGSLSGAGAPTSGGTAGAAGGGGASAAATAPPPGVSLSTDPTSVLAGSDLTSGVGTSGLGGSIGTGAASTNLLTSGLPSGVSDSLGGEAGAVAPVSTISPISNDPGAALTVSNPTSLTTGSPSFQPSGGGLFGGGSGGGSGGSGGGGILGGFAKNPLIPLALGADLLNAGRQPAYSGNLSGEAGTLAQQAAQLQNYETSGTLPPGVQGNLNAAGDAAAASIRAQYASRGMSGSSAEAQDLSNVALRIQGQGEEYAAQLFQQGVQDAQMSNQLYQYLMGVSIQQDNALGSSIGNLAGALAMSSRPLQASGG